MFYVQIIQSAVVVQNQKNVLRNTPKQKQIKLFPMNQDFNFQISKRMLFDCFYFSYQVTL